MHYTRIVTIYAFSFGKVGKRRKVFSGTIVIVITHEKYARQM